MIEINISNFEQKILFDQNCHRLLSGLEHLVNKWIFGLRANITETKRDAMIEIINSITIDHIEKLSDYFGDKISLRTINTNLVYSNKSTIECLEKDLNGLPFSDNLCISMNDKEIFFTVWR